MSINTVVNVTNLFKWLVVLLVCSMLWMGISSISSGNFTLFGPSKTDLAKTVAAQDVKIKQLEDQIKNLKKDAQIQKDLSDLDIEVVSDNSVKETTIVEKTSKQTIKVKKETDKVKADPKLTEEEKDKVTSAILFDSLEEARCSHVTQSCYKVST